MIIRFVTITDNSYHCTAGLERTCIMVGIRFRLLEGNDGAMTIACVCVCVCILNATYLYLKNVLKHNFTHLQYT